MMGKRSDFERIERDFYPTPYKAVLPLIEHLPEKFKYYEPCAGDGRLCDWLNKHGGLSMGHTDIEPQCNWVGKKDALDVIVPDATDYVITNPPWNRKILHPMIEHFVLQKPTWFLFDADWIHTKQSAFYTNMIEKIVSIGRVKWIEDSKSVGKDNCCWYLFNKMYADDIKFYGRTE